MSSGQAVYFLMVQDFSTMLITDFGIFKTDKNYREAIDGFLPARLAGKRVCTRLRASAVK
jgi:hypothetical protein